MKKKPNLLDSDKDTKIYTSSCSTPLVSAPSSPGRISALFYSAPASPIHFLLSTNSILTPPNEAAGNEFAFDANCFPMTSADDLFSNGQILPINHQDHHRCGRSELRNMSLRRVRSEEKFQQHNDDHDVDNIDDHNNDNKLDGKKKSDEVQGRPWLLRNSKRWVSLFLYRSKSEGRNNGRHKYFWSSFSPVVKDKRITENTSKHEEQQEKIKTKMKKKSVEQSKRLGLSAHYTANRAQSEEMRKKTYLPYRQGIFGCVGINPRPSSSFNAFAARAFNSSFSS